MPHDSNLPAPKTILVADLFCGAGGKPLPEDRSRV